MKLNFRNILYVGAFFAFLLISSFFLLSFAVIYDFLDWLFERLSLIRNKFKKTKYSNRLHPEIKDEFYRKNIQEFAQKYRG